MPASPGERRSWLAFGALRADPASDLSQLTVAAHADVVRSLLSQKTVGFALLREAIGAEVDRRREVRKAAERKPSREERLARLKAERETKIRYWQGVAQAADSATIAAEACALRAERDRLEAVGMLRRILADIKAGRWTVADEGQGVIAELRAFLALPSRDGGADARQDAGVLELAAPD